MADKINLILIPYSPHMSSARCQTTVLVFSCDWISVRRASRPKQLPIGRLWGVCVVAAYYWSNTLSLALPANRVSSDVAAGCVHDVGQHLICPEKMLPDIVCLYEISQVPCTQWTTPEDHRLQRLCVCSCANVARAGLIRHLYSAQCPALHHFCYWIGLFTTKWIRE